MAGDAELSTEVADAAAALWRKRSRRWLPEQAERVTARQRRAGEVAFLLEPNLKDGRGGLRDVQAIRWAEAADRVMFEGDDAALDTAYELVLAARVELHRHAERAGDILLLQEQDAVAAALGDRRRGCPDGPGGDGGAHHRLAQRRGLGEPGGDGHRSQSLADRPATASWRRVSSVATVG